MSDEGWKALAIIIPSAIATIGIIFTAILNYRMNAMHKTVNGKMEKLLTVSNAASKAEGKLEQKNEQDKIDDVKNLKT